MEIELEESYRSWTDEIICAKIYSQTNQYRGEIWDKIQPLLSETRTHTALSIGDEVQINEITYVVADFDFVKKEEAEYKYMEDCVFSVRKKVSA